jgi:hypothetical protein
MLRALLALILFPLRASVLKPIGEALVAGGTEGSPTPSWRPPCGAWPREPPKPRGCPTA